MNVLEAGQAGEQKQKCLGEDECEGYSKGRVGRKNPSHSAKENLISFVK